LAVIAAVIGALLKTNMQRTVEACESAKHIAQIVSCAHQYIEMLMHQDLPCGLSLSKVYYHLPKHGNVKDFNTCQRSDQKSGKCRW